MSFRECKVKNMADVFFIIDFKWRGIFKAF